MSVIRVEAVGGREFAVEVVEPAVGGTDGPAGRTFRYRVTADEAVLRTLRLDTADETAVADLVRESLRFLLAREPASSVLSRFELSVISRYFPEYLDEIGDRLSR